MNKFKIIKGQEQNFENLWKERESLLGTVEGFIQFHLIKGVNGQEYTVYMSHSTWSSKDHFENWTRSNSFKKAHKNAGKNRHMYVGHPVFEGFEVII